MRRWKKERIMKVVRRYALFVQEKGLKNITARILKKHSENMRKPQALGRGFIVRTIMKRARWVAFRMGKYCFLPVRLFYLFLQLSHVQSYPLLKLQ